ncbi:MAG: hypothetical protein ACRD0P_35365, partial [Stackebrandtia sp.]
AWSMRALAGVVVAGMLWSAVNVQHNIAPGGPSDPLYWFSYLLEAMISVCLVVIMIGTNKVSEWGILQSRRQVALAELALLALTVGLNTYPYLRGGDWYNVGVHAVAPVMIGVALLVHDAASQRYGQAILQATDQVRDLPDPAEQIRRSKPTFVSFIRQTAPDTRAPQMAALPGADETVPAKSSAASSSSPPPVPAAEDSAETVETVDPVVEPDIWTPKTSSRRDADSADSVADGGKSSSSKSDLSDDDPLADYDTGQFRIADTLEQELAELRAERKRARSAKQRAAANGTIID